MKLRMNVGIASAAWAYQVGQVVDVPEDLGKKWIRSHLGERVPDTTPLSRPDVLADLSAEETLHRICENCQRRRAQIAFRGHACCRACYRAVLELGGE